MLGSDVLQIPIALAAFLTSIYFFMNHAAKHWRMLSISIGFALMSHTSDAIYYFSAEPFMSWLPKRLATNLIFPAVEICMGLHYVALLLWFREFTLPDRRK